MESATGLKNKEQHRKKEQKVKKAKKVSRSGRSPVPELPAGKPPLSGIAGSAWSWNQSRKIIRMRTGCIVPYQVTCLAC